MCASILILGRQPALGIAELESLYGSDAVEPYGQQAALLDAEPNTVQFNRLGGSVKLAKVLTSFEHADWTKLVAYIEETLPKHLGYLPDGKLKLGLSAYGFGVTGARVGAAALSIKKIVKHAGRSVRVVPNNEPALNSAQVLHNQLTGELGMELVLIRNGDSSILAQTVREQDIEAYAARDQGRPKRDARIGMLPPKLAQIIINLAKPPTDRCVVLDPFCGTGVVLQEASLMGFLVRGADLDARMVEYSTGNLRWLSQQYGLSEETWNCQLGDATRVDWPQFAALACETYLGRPFSSQPKPDVLNEVMRDVDTIHKKFLQNVARQTASGFRFCIAVPAWKTAQGFKHLKTLDSLEELGYNRLKFVHARDEDLVYYRDGQFVARELIILIRK